MPSLDGFRTWSKYQPRIALLLSALAALGWISLRLVEHATTLSSPIARLGLPLAVGCLVVAFLVVASRWLPHTEEFRTWLTWTGLLAVVMSVVLALAWSSRQFLAFAEQQPTSVGEVALAVAVGCFLSIGVLLWWSGRSSA